VKKIIFYTSLIAWVLSLIVHVSARMGENVEKAFPAVMGLHFGIFLLLIPTIIMLRKNPEIQEFEKKNWNERARNPLRFWELALSHCPLALKILTAVCFLYSVVNLMTGVSGKDLPVVTSFSGMWIAFYAVIVSISYPFKPREVL
jgi:hypothetical protein